MSVLKKFDFHFFNQMYHICGVKAHTTYSSNMKEITFDWVDRIMPYEGLFSNAWVYYEYSKIKKEMPDTFFWLNLCVMCKTNLRKLRLGVIYINTGETYTAFFKKLNDYFKEIDEYSESIDRYLESYDNLNFFIYFQTEEEDIDYPPFPELTDILSDSEIHNYEESENENEDENNDKKELLPLQYINGDESFLSTECVICMSEKPNVIFCNCGHIPIYKKCNDWVNFFNDNPNKCPICKTDSVIKRKI